MVIAGYVHNQTCKPARPKLTKVWFSVAADRFVDCD